MNEFSEGAVQTHGITTAYLRSNPPEKKTLLGQSKTPLSVILLHGITDSAACWGRVASGLIKDYDVILPDARGHGFSNAPETGYGVEERAADVAGLIEALKLSRPVLVGHSMGAETAVAVTALYPDLVRAAVLEDPPWPGRFWGSTPEERAERAAQWREEIMAQKDRSKEALIAQAREQHPGWSEEELAPWAEAKQQVSPNVTAIVLAPRRRWTDYIRQGRCPLLLITGDPDHGAIVTPKTTAEAAQLWSNGLCVHIPNAGHSIHRDQFDIYQKTLRDYLAKIN